AAARARLRRERGRRHRALRGAVGLARGDRARLDPEGPRLDALEQAGRGRAARAAASDALLQDAQAQHPAATALSARKACRAAAIAQEIGRRRGAWPWKSSISLNWTRHGRCSIGVSRG